MNWRARMGTARWRGMAFLADSHETRLGRRLAMHEYPGSDEPSVEDLGAQAGGVKINAYFIGADYDTDRDAFLALLNQPGADWLTHPWLGLMWVRPHEWTVSEANSHGGTCTIAVTFAPGGDEALAAAATDAVDSAEAALDGMQAAACAGFALGPMNVQEQAAFGIAVRGSLGGALDALAFASLSAPWMDAIRSATRAAQDAIDAAALATGQAALAVAVPDAWRVVARAAVQGDAQAENLNDGARGRAMAQLVRAAADGAPDAAAGPNGNDAQARRLRQQMLAACAGRLALADARYASGAIGTLARYRTEDERDAAANAVRSAFDALFNSLGDAAFQAAAQARSATLAALQAMPVRPVRRRVLMHPVPATVLAWRMEVDEAALLAQNAVRHPLFVQGEVAA